MIVRFAVERMQEGHLVYMLGQTGEDAGNPLAALALLPEGERRLHQRADVVDEEAGVPVEAGQLLVRIVDFRRVLILTRS